MTASKKVISYEQTNFYCHDLLNVQELLKFLLSNDQ